MRSSRTFATMGFSLMELLVVAAIMAILLALLMPAMSRARRSASMATCERNLYQVRIAIATYATDHRVLPQASRRPSLGPDPLRETRYFADVIAPYLAGDLRVLKCPRDTGDPSYFERERSSYEYGAETSGGTDDYQLHDYENFHD